MNATWSNAAADFGGLVKETVVEFQRHKAQWLAAAIAYFALFAIAPLVIVVVEIAGLFLGSHRAVLDQLHRYLAQTAGVEAARGIDAIVTATFSHRRSGFVAQAAGWAAFVLGAIGFFGSLQEALNTIWECETGQVRFSKTRKRADPLFCNGYRRCIRLTDLARTELGRERGCRRPRRRSYRSSQLPSQIVDIGVSLVLVTLVFGLLYEYLPDCRIAWRDVWLGAAASAVLFVAGQTLLAWYIGRTGNCVALTAPSAVSLYFSYGPFTRPRYCCSEPSSPTSTLLSSGRCAPHAPLQQSRSINRPE